MSPTEAGSAPHKCEFPVQPPEGSWSHPGACRQCGKTWAQSQTEQKVAEAQAVMADRGLVVVRRDDLRDVLRFGTGAIDVDGGAFDRLSAAVEAGQ